MSSKDAKYDNLPGQETKETKEDNFFIFKILLCCFWICIFAIIFIIYLYIHSVLDERIDIDNKNTTIYKPYLYKNTNNYANCTLENPCIYSCNDVKKYFDRIPEDCEYNDYMNIILGICIVLIIIACINCICSKK
mgnify:FL=1|tara:strand:- start:1116 stop:1520 length:405 start_codon:yes stop_codon:yes gene_type:complete